MKKLWIGVLLMLVLFVNCPSPPLNAAKIYINQGEYQKAKEQVLVAIEQMPNNFECYCVLAKVNILLGDWLGGSEAFQNAYKIDSTLTLKWMTVAEKSNLSSYWQNFYNTALKLIIEKKYEDALKNLAFAKRIDPTNVQQFILEGNIQSAKGDKEGALKTYAKVISIDPESPEAYYFIALSMYEKKQFDSSLIYFSNAMKYYGKQYDQVKGALFQNVAFDKNLAAELVDLWNNKKTEELDRVLKVKFGFEQPEAQKRNVERFTKITDGFGLSYYYAGMVCYSSGKDSLALKYLNAAADLLPGDINVLFFMGELLMAKLKKYDEARGCFEKITVIKPDDFAAWFYIGVCYAQVKNYKKAIEMYEEKALKLEPKSIDVMTNLAYAYREMGNTKKALEYLMRIQELEKENK